MAASLEVLSWPIALYDDRLKDRVDAAKVLCVGAGGIGCELLKTLVLSGFVNIEVVDMDTIETSNLNRQFLFRRQHVGQSKAKVAAEAVQRLNPKANIVAHQANIKEPQFNVEFFKSFSLILNGLDNLEARRHVNRMALAAEVPLIESGTTGYLGQVTVHIKGQTECFECRPKPAPKSYPICTIRNTPDKFIHCVVWAKELLFPRLLGKQEQATDLDDTQAAGEKESGPIEETPPSFFLRATDEPAMAYTERVFDRLYGHDIEKLLGVEELWKSRAKPTPLYLRQVIQQPAETENNPQAANGAALHSTLSAAKTLDLTNPHAVLSLEDNARLFVQALRHYHDQRASDIGSAVFDKDDVLAVELVTAAANLRAAAYGIQQQSLFETKGMAGNIIHAIATTNAIISGLIVTEACKLLAGAADRVTYTYAKEHPSMNKVIAATQPNPPVVTCMVCGKSQVGLTLNTHKVTLQQLLDKVLRGALAIACPTVECGEFMYEEGEGLEDDEIEFYQQLLPKPLAKLPGGAVGHGAVLSVKDQLQNLDVSIIITHQADIDEEAHPEGFILQGAAPQAPAGPSAAANGTTAGPSTEANGITEEEDDILEMYVPEERAAHQEKKKRRQADDAGAGPSSSKRHKAGDADVVDLT